MNKKKYMIFLLIILLLVLFIIFIFFYLNYIKIDYDKINISDYPQEYICDNNNNYIEYQTDNNCASYATSYVLRHLNEKVDGEIISQKMKRILGFVFPLNIINVLNEYGYNASVYYGNIDSLKRCISKGIPVIAFVSIPSDTHYICVIGYDKDYIYIVDSMVENSNVKNTIYNRKLSIEEFNKIWKTNTLLHDNIYITIE